MQTKSTHHHYAPIRMAKIKTRLRCWRWCRETGSPRHCWGKWKMVEPPEKIVSSFLKKQMCNYHITDWTPGNLSWRNENLCPHKACKCMWLAPFFGTAKIWKEPRCFSTGEWFNYSPPVPWNIPQKWKRMHSWYTPLFEWISRELKGLKKASPQRLHTDIFPFMFHSWMTKWEKCRTD